MAKSKLVADYERLMEKRRKADLARTAAATRLESAEKAADEVKAKVAKYNKSPKELRDWAVAEEKDLTAELAKLEGKIDEPSDSDVDI